jgi:large subunit ribosomal protein L22
VVKKTYQVQLNKTDTARAYSTNAAISVKYATEICREIRGRPLEKAIAFLRRVASHQEFLPLRKFNKKVAHRKGESKSKVKSGRYPEKACRAFIKLLEGVKANADFKGMDADNLLVVHAFASTGFRRYSVQPKGRIGGKRRRKKSTHLEVIVREAK